MNIALVDPTKHQDEGFANSLEHRVQRNVHSLKGLVEELYKLSDDPNAHKIIARELTDLYGAQLALSIIAERVSEAWLNHALKDGGW